MPTPGSSIMGTTADMCPCCEVTPMGLECRTRGGFAMYCGFPGFDFGSSTFYRTLTLSGGWSVNIYTTAAGCTGDIDCIIAGSYSGVCSYNVDTCDRTDAGQLAINVSGDHPEDCCDNATVPTCDLINYNCGGITVPPDSAIELVTMSDTVKQQSIITPCVMGFIETTAATGTITLSDQDTAADAIARLIAMSSWSSWADPSPGFCTSSWEIPTFGPGFNYTEAQFRYTATGLTPSMMYTLTLDVYQSVYGMMSYTMIGTISSSFMTDSMGNATITGDVPITQGYDTYVTNPVVS